MHASRVWGIFAFLVFVGGVACFTETAHAASKEIKKEAFGQLADGRQIELYTLTNPNGLRVKIMTYGATILSVETPDRNGKLANITLAFDSCAEYLKDTPYFGVTVGRYANRIAGGRFTLDGVEYKLAKNEGPAHVNHLHGGTRGFDKVLWKAEPILGADSVAVKFSYDSPDGDEGYPGKLATQVTYGLSDDNELTMRYQAVTDKPTVVNLTNHAYWNLTGGTGDVLGHQLLLNADRYLPVDENLIPLGELKKTQGTPMDFMAPNAIGARIGEVKGGYDHCYVLCRKDDHELSLAAKVTEPTSGRVLEVYTTQPAIQFYSGNFLDGSIRAGGTTYRQHFGFCLETQHYPDAPNRPAFPTTVLRPNERYEQLTVCKFRVE